jgi:hypothetical protein
MIICVNEIISFSEAHERHLGLSSSTIALPAMAGRSAR